MTGRTASHSFSSSLHLVRNKNKKEKKKKLWMDKERNENDRRLVLAANMNTFCVLHKNKRLPLNCGRRGDEGNSGVGGGEEEEDGR